MAVTEFQRAVCRTIASSRIASGESYVAGGVALNDALGASRLSQDVDVFHDAAEAVAQSYEQDRANLEVAGFHCELMINRTTFIECKVSKSSMAVVVQWVQDSAFRFFPLQTHPDFGLTLHPFDLATNKVLALVGRLEVRDWIYINECNQKLQPLGYLAWAAAVKDPGLSPVLILDQAHRSGRYTQLEIDSLAFDSNIPDAGELGRRWKALLKEAEIITTQLPPNEVGNCILNLDGTLVTEPSTELPALVASGKVRFHTGTLRGSYPTVRSLID